MAQRSGWLRVREAGEQATKPRWCTLENGVLWLYRRPGEQEGRDALPLHDAVVGDCEPPAPLQLAVRCRRSGRLLALGTTSKEEYQLWMTALTESAREWREKRRASVLNRQLMALAAENEKNGVVNVKTAGLLGEDINADFNFTPRRRSEVPRPTARVTGSRRDGSQVPVKRLPLKELVLTSKEQPRWSKLPEVKESGLLGLLTEEQVALEELKFSALVEEIRFSAELSTLLRLATRAVSWKDPLPVFHRRSIVASLNKVKRSSDSVLRVAERHWSQRVTLQSAVFSLLGDEARAAGWSDAYNEYCAHMAELRDLLRRASLERPEVATGSRSARHGLELALVPLQHLTTLRQLLQTLYELLPAGAPEHLSARSARDFLNEMLDSCYQVLTEQSGSETVAEMDNALQFDLSSMTPVAPGPQLLYRRNKAQTQALPTISVDEVMPDDEDKRIAGRMSKSRSRPSIFTGVRSAAHFIRRRTAEGLGLSSSRATSMPTLLFDVPTQSSGSPLSDEDEEEEGVEEPISETPGTVPRLFGAEPLYQDYCLAIAEEMVERAVQRVSEDELEPASQTRRKGCTRWSQHPRVLEAGVLGEISDDTRRLAEAKFELLVSEASFLRSLRVLESHFAHCPEFYDEDVMPPAQRHVLFSGIEAHRACSERLLASMESCWEADLFLSDLCSVLHRHATSATARVAATACVNQLLVGLTLQKLMRRPQFPSVLARLEGSVACGNFSLLSFVTLPPRRLGRIKLLLENVARLMARLPEVKLMERAACESAKDAVGRLLTRGEMASRRAHSDEALQELARRLSFRRVPRLALAAEGRALLHQGTWRVLGRREDARGPMRAKSSHPELQAFLLSDLLLVAAPDGIGGVTAVDYCARSGLVVRPAGPGSDAPLPGYLENDEAARHALYVTFRGHAGKTVELVVCCGGGAERARWLGSLHPEVPPPSPALRSRQQHLLRALRPHAPQLPDEASLATGDVIAVLRNPGDGWVHGRSLLDGSCGWIPSALTVQLSSGRKSVTFLVEEAREDARFSLA